MGLFFFILILKKGEAIKYETNIIGFDEFNIRVFYRVGSKSKNSYQPTF